MVSESSLFCLENPTTWPFPKAFESFPQPDTWFLSIAFNIIFLLTRNVFQLASSFRVTSIKTDFTAKFKFNVNNVLFKTRCVFRGERTIRVYTGWAKSRYTVINYIPCNYFWPTLYKYKIMKRRQADFYTYNKTHEKEDKSVTCFKQNIVWWCSRAIDVSKTRRDVICKNTYECMYR